jgi:hypothetical protein
VAWAKVANTLPDHPKILAVGHEAAWLYVCGLCYCSRHLTDGFIPVGALERLADLPNAEGSAEALVETGLWTVRHDGWNVPGYLEHQRSRDQVEAERASARDRMARMRDRKRYARTSPEVTPEVRSTDTDKREPHSREPAARRAYDSDFVAWWDGYPRKVDKATAAKAYRARRRDGVARGALTAARDHYATAVVGQPLEYVKHAATFLAKDGPWSEWMNGPPAGFSGNGHQEYEELR